MKKIASLSISLASAALVSSLTAFAQPAKTDAKPVDAAPAATPVPAAAPAAATIVRLTPKDKLPESVLQLIVIDREPGDVKGRTAETRNAVLMQYTGWLYDPAAPDGKGKQFDSSAGRSTPFGFILGAGRVIKGWDLGVPGMKIKGKRTLVIPPSLGYGDRGAGNAIPPNATLLFDVELFDIVN